MVNIAPRRHRREKADGPKNPKGPCRNKPLVDLSHMRKHYTYITKNKQLWIYVVSLCVLVWWPQIRSFLFSVGKKYMNSVHMYTKCRYEIIKCGLL